MTENEFNNIQNLKAKADEARVNAKDARALKSAWKEKDCGYYYSYRIELENLPKCIADGIVQHYLELSNRYERDAKSLYDNELARFEGKENT